MRAHLHSRKRSERAFTLIEMLVVVAIITLLLVFTTPALMRTLQASKLASTGESLMGSISEAQQTAYAQNTPVELRFFSYAGEFGTNPTFRAYQIFKVQTTSAATGGGGGSQVTESIVPVGNLIKLSDGITIASDISLSPALSGQGLSDEKSGGVTPGYSGVSGATYCAIRFMPDGTCRKVGANTNGMATLTFQILPQSFFTISYDIGAPVTSANLPKNFYTIQIDPFTSKARNYRPGF